MKKLVAAALTTGLIACAGETGEGDEEATGETEQGLSMQAGVIVAALDSGFTDVGSGYALNATELVTNTHFNINLTAKAKWTAVSTTNLAWDADKVRQGQTLNMGRSGSQLGVMTVVWELSGTINPLNLGEVAIGPLPIAADLTGCEPKLGGAEYECTATSPLVPLMPHLPLLPYVDFGIDITFKVTPPDGASATRTLMFGDEEGPQGDLSITGSSQNDALAMPCNKPAGTTIDYVLDPVTWTPVTVTAVQQTKFVIGTVVLLPLPIPVPIDADLFSAPFGDPGISNPEFTLAGPGGTVSLGELQANNVSPTVSSVGPFSGQEGSPVQFSATTTSACPITSYVWSFSNGTTSFGPNPQRTFGDDGVFDGQLTVTDMTNLSGTGSLQVSIANRAPVANAGPNTSGAWGTAIALNGQAVDPGADDQATLTYTWNFGDGTPGTGGASVSHAYAAPGDFTATLTVCDDHVCDTDTTLVHIRKRTVAVSYTGTNVGTFSAQATLAGSIVDELGQPVVNGALAFNLAAADAGSANTNAAGNASRTIDLALGAGTYPISVAFAGNGFYDGGASGELFDVSRMAASLAYTGSLSGGANKTVNLSAKLVDALDRPLAGKLVSFQMGTQSASATTDANGIATAPLKLAQKNGQYQLTSSYAGNATEWTSASTSSTFTIGGGK